MIATQALNQIPRGEWADHTVGEMMATDLPAVTSPAGADAMEALAKMQRTGSSRLLVTEGNQLLGIVSLKDLLGFLNLKLELESRDDGSPQDAFPGSGRTKDGALVRY